MTLSISPKTAYETCWNCNGSGLQLSYVGEPDTCRECGGDTVVRRRDERGRFSAVPVVLDDHQNFDNDFYFDIAGRGDEGLETGGAS